MTTAALPMAARAGRARLRRRLRKIAFALSVAAVASKTILVFF